MREIGVLEAKTQLSALLDVVEREGEEILITRHGRPVARLTRAVSGDRPRRLSGQELVVRFKALQERVGRENSEIRELTANDILAMREP